MWFLEGGTPNVGRITTNGTVTEYPILNPAHTNFASITNGANGDLWFTDDDADSIGHIAIGTQAPIVHITNPSANATVSGAVNIAGVINPSSTYNLMLYVFDSSSHAVVSRYQYGLPVSNTSTNYSWNTASVPNGIYTIILSAKDAQGNKDANSTATLKVTVQN
jgi:hypothetical protein